MAVARGISPLQFYEFTPYEITLFLDGSKEKRHLEIKEEIELMGIAVKVAIVNALNGESEKIFKDEEEVDTSNSNENYKEETLKRLKETFNI